VRPTGDIADRLASSRPPTPDDEERAVYPDDLKYTPEHEWVREGDAVRVGITEYAQDQLGDIVYVSLPSVGDSVAAGETCGELESTKSVSDVYAPVTGEVVAVNEALDSTPELVNNDPYGEGWLFEVRLADGGSLDGLLSAADYQAGL
jgi:glycine cleavage system H protein